MKKSIKSVMMDRDDFKREHVRLGKVLKSKSRKDDKHELKLQQREVKEVMGKRV